MEKGLISVDRWSDHSQVYFLTHLHSDHTQCLSSSWTKGPLFCSRLTAKLFPFKFPNFNLSLLRILEIGSWHSVSLVSPSSGSETTVDVMAIDAHHCPGPSVVWIQGCNSINCLIYIYIAVVFVYTLNLFCFALHQIYMLMLFFALHFQLEKSEKNYQCRETEQCLVDFILNCDSLLS